MTHFQEFLPVFTATVTIFSAALFGFLLPKWADHFNDRPRTKLKDTLAIKKDLESNEVPIDPDLDRIIAFYTKEFIHEELKFVENDKYQDKQLDKHVRNTFGLAIIIPFIGLALCLILSGIIH